MAGNAKRSKAPNRTTTTKKKYGAKAGNYWPELNEKKCHECGKEIFVTPEWVYKRGEYSRVKYFCSWGCLCKFDKKRTTRDYTRVK